MKLPTWLSWLRATAADVAPPAPKKKGISPIAVAQTKGGRSSALAPRLVPSDPHPVTAAEDLFAPYKPPKGVVPEDRLAADGSLAMDEGFYGTDWGGVGNGFNFAEGIGFFGYQYLAELSQRPEYRRMVEILALDMTREWIRFTYGGDEDKSDRIAKIEAEFTRLAVKDCFRRVAELDGFFGRGHIFMDFGQREGSEIDTPLLIDKRKVKKGSLKRITVVEPTWVYPNLYSSTDPLSPTFYKPQSWYVMAKSVHQSRLLTFVSRPVPDILKPAYAFGGLSLSQMAKPYVDNWLNNRQSVADLLQSFTVFVLKTDMATLLMGGGAEDLNNRADVFNNYRRNSGLMMINKGDGQADPGEELTNVSAPLGGLNDLLSSSQEQMSAVAGEPLVKYLGVTPSGLNASSDGEIRVYYDAVSATQERLFHAPLTTILQLVQLNVFGDVDPDISFEFIPLWQLDEAEIAEARKADAEVDGIYVDHGILSAEEVRTKLASDKNSPWANLDVSDVPELPETGGEGGDPFAETGEPEGGAEDQALSPSKSTLNYHGLPIVIETPKGAIRRGGYNGATWEAVMAADYGYIVDTWSAEGRGEELDCFVGPNRDSQTVFIIDQRDLGSGQFDEHKACLGYDTKAGAVADYLASYDSRGVERIMAVTAMDLDAFRAWIETADLYRPLSPEASDVVRSDEPGWTLGAKA